VKVKLTLATSPALSTLALAAMATRAVLRVKEVRMVKGDFQS
jgi:hypothetical protein